MASSSPIRATLTHAIRLTLMRVSPVRIDDLWVKPCIQNSDRSLYTTKYESILFFGLFLTELIHTVYDFSVWQQLKAFQSWVCGVENRLCVDFRFRLCVTRALNSISTFINYSELMIDAWSKHFDCEFNIQWFGIVIKTTTKQNDLFCDGMFVREHHFMCIFNICFSSIFHANVANSAVYINSLNSINAHQSDSIESYDLLRANFVGIYAV